MYLSKGDPLLESLNDLIQKCVESGLSNRDWSFLEAKHVLQTYRNEEEGNNSHTALAFFHLRASFVFILIG